MKYRSEDAAAILIGGGFHFVSLGVRETWRDAGVVDSH